MRDPVFEKRTGTYRKFGGQRFIIDTTYRTKTEARNQAAVWRDSDFLARVVKASNGYVVYVRRTKAARMRTARNFAKIPKRGGE